MPLKRPQTRPTTDSQVSEPTAALIGLNVAAASDLHLSQRGQVDRFVVNATHGTIRLNNKLAAVRGVVARGDYSPTDQAVAVKNELIEAIDAQLVRLRSILEVALPAFNRLAVEKGIPHVWVEKKDGR